MRKRLVWDTQTRKWVEPHQVRRAYTAKGDMPMPMVMGPIKERVSPVDGSVISSREQLREHNRRNNVVDIGNEKLERNVPKTSRREYQDAVGEAYRKAASGYTPKAEEAGTLDGEKVETKIIGEA